MERILKKLINQMIMSVKSINQHTNYILNKEKGTICYEEGDMITNSYRGYLTTFAYYQEFDKGNISEERLK